MVVGSLCTSTLEELESTLARLKAIWDSIGLTKEQRCERRQHFYGHITTLCEKIIEDEDALKLRIMNKIERNTKDILKLCEELSVTAEDAVEGLTLLELDAVLEEQAAGLHQMKEDRLHTLKTLQEKDEGLCEVLCETPFYVPSGLVPSKEDLKAVEDHISCMQKEKSEREAVFKTLKAGLLNFLELLEKSPEDSFSQEMIFSEDDEVSLSKACLQRLRAVHSDLEFQVQENEAQSLELREKIQQLWDLLDVGPADQQAFLATAPKHTPSNIAKLEEELERLKLLRLQNISVFVEKLQDELRVWWNKCYVGDSERERVSRMYADEANEEVLVAYELEVHKWKKYYQDNSEILTLVGNFMSLFQRMVELEERAKDPSRLFNTRGGTLLQEEKAKKKVKNELPRVQERLEELAGARQQREGQPFMIYDQEVIEYIDGLWESHQMKKENEKCKRHQAKAGVDGKHGGGITISKTPGSLRKRAHEGDDPGTTKRPKQTVTSKALFKSPTKLPKSPTKGQQGRPLSECNPLITFHPATPAQADTSLHSTMSYDKFEAGLGQYGQGEVVHSSMLEEEQTRASPTLDQARERRLRDSLHLASPSKAGTPRSRAQVRPPVSPAQRWGAMRRAASQPCLTGRLHHPLLPTTSSSRHLSPRYFGNPRYFQNKEHPLRFLI